MSLFHTTRNLSPKDLQAPVVPAGAGAFSGALNQMAKAQTDLPSALPQPRKSTPSQDESAQAQEHSQPAEEGVKREPIAQPGSGKQEDPLASPKGRSAFKRPVGVRTSSDPTKLVPAAPAPSAPAAGQGKSAQTLKSVKDASVAAPESKDVSADAASGERAPAKAVSPAPDGKEKRTLSSVKQDSRQKSVEGYDAKIFLNTFKVFGPIVSAIAFQPGKDGDLKSTAAGVQVMRRETEKITAGLCKMAEVDPLDPDKQWVVAQFRTLASEHVANQWRRNPNPETFTADPYVEAFAEIAKNDAVEPDKMEFPDMTDSLRVRISIMKSLAPVIKEYSLFENVVASMVPGFKVDRKVLFADSSELIQFEAKRLVESMGVVDTDPAYLIAYQAMLNHCGSSMASSVAYACDRMLDKLDRMEQTQRQSFLQERQKTGNDILIDMHAMREDFHDTMDALLQVSTAAMQSYAQRSIKGPSV